MGLGDWLFCDAPNCSNEIGNIPGRFCLNHRDEWTKCATCGSPTRMLGTKRCDPCWELERRLPEYLKTANGRANVASRLADALERETKP